ncbi:aspartyl/asparaginyl beta-hydroxylase domain-containing protein [Sphingomonas sp.]|uniref:aspartyl/asparaginyl beta-hydroxylase domain-containing protein n=1 Tax=Sphingomonas sp. TaxID=28214 RepID=UPI001B1B101F|nr:aspartyl/asparaginyl beta-hydroxylase domain-containing protein [Sphingomonas sp.]MBO9714420.1 aspartyl/asparaginyl beta-hydroxylase domain-containing protein [Sphingomonas sp.]
MATAPASGERHYPDRVRLPLAFDPDALAADLARLARHDWIAHFVRQNYEGDWSALPLRAHAGASHPVQMIYSPPGATAFVDTPLLAETPYFRDVIAVFRCPVTCVRLMRLAAGSVIREHEDNDLAAERGWARIHVPVTTNPGVEFFLNGEPVTMRAGEAWYLRLSDPHRAANRGETDRVHLVIDAQLDDWLAAMLG